MGDGRFKHCIVIIKLEHVDQNQCNFIRNRTCKLIPILHDVTIAIQKVILLTYLKMPLVV